MARDEFSAKTRRIIAERAGHMCSNPTCRRLTIGPHSDPDKSLNAGRACHIRAAASGGPRYDDRQTSDERISIDNALWLCAECSDKIDKDWRDYPAAKLMTWRSEHEGWVAGNPSIPKLPDLRGRLKNNFQIVLVLFMAITDKAGDANQRTIFEQPDEQRMGVHQADV
ncbi:MAG TPA: hypothetical protein VGM54_19610, partial [Chthoniobacter sp.]